MASNVEIIASNDLRVGMYALLKNKPCKVLEISRSKNGKHGGAKIHIIGLDIFSLKKVEDLIPSSHNMELPIVKKEELSVLDVLQDGYVSLLLKDMSGTRQDIKVLDEGDAKKITEMLDDGKSVLVTVLSAMGKEVYDSFKGDRSRSAMEERV
eukprot:TRINITY_DN147_c0_g1_i7.p1 TRINITY_DN147_c0_g1~~TRINITY_DN147_c0_g1_i7.p1  ORF type:complete len:153 (-),score=28.79 TRINITY_DN147_c0_g1_i7:97-555(-)